MMQRNSFLSFKAFKSYLVASILATISTTLGVVVDGVIVSRLLGHEGLSAINLSAPLIQLLVTFHLLINVGGAMMAAFAIGKREFGSVKGYFSFSMISCFVLGLVFIVAGLFFTDYVTAALCTHAELFPLVQDYIRVILLTAPVYLILPGFAVFVRTDNAPRLATMALLGANVVNLILDIVFIKYLHWGITGSSLATSIGYAVGIVTLLLHFRRKNCLLGLTVPSRRLSYKKVFLLGMPVALASVFMLVRMLSINHIALAYLGLEGIGVLAVLLNLLLIVTMFVSGTSQAMQPVGAILMGEKDYAGVRLVAMRALRMLSAILAFCMVLILTFPTLVSHLFGLAGSAIETEANLAIRAMSLSFILFGITYFLMIIYQITQRHRLSTFVSVTQSFMVVPVMGFLAMIYPHLIWWAFLGGEALTFLLVVTIATITRRKEKDKNLAPITLLTRSTDEDSLDVSIGRDPQELASFLTLLDDFLTGHVVGSGTKNSAEVCCKELMTNVIKYGYSDKRKHFIDTKVIIHSDHITISIKDDGRPFDPVSCSSPPGSGLHKVKEACSDIQYKCLMNQNTTYIIINNFLK